MPSRISRWCKHPLGLGIILILIALLFFSLPLVSGIARTDAIDLDYGDFVSIGAFIATVFIAIFSIIPNLQSMAETSRSAHYSELDTMYLQILSMALDKPYLRCPNSLNPFEPEQKEQYETYAFIVWNFLETIHDRCQKDKELSATWAPVVAAEHELHRQWFERETIPYDAVAAPKFCLPFCDFIWEKSWTKSDWSYDTPEKIRARSKHISAKSATRDGNPLPIQLTAT